MDVLLGQRVVLMVVLSTLGTAVYSDLRRRRVPNVLTMPVMLLGFVLNTVYFGGDGMQRSVAGWALGFGLLFPLYVLRGMGAGDVKLMAALGALEGPEFVWFAILWAGVAGGIMAFVGLARSGKLMLALRHIYTCHALPRPGGDSMITVGRMPYAPAIALGSVLVLGGVRWIGA